MTGPVESRRAWHREALVYLALTALAMLLLWYAHRAPPRPDLPPETFAQARAVLADIERLRARVSWLVERAGCQGRELSFAHASDTQYDNPNSPADGRCNVFADGLHWPAPPAGLPQGGHGRARAAGQYIVSAGDHVIGVPDLEFWCSEGACKDITLKLYLSDAGHGVCAAINWLAGNGLPPMRVPRQWLRSDADSRFRGEFPDSINRIWITALDGRWQGCFQEPDGRYIAYGVLLARGG
ncbi:MAG: hypothetical protein R3E87_22160 [Burkholderiaceae bacterium]